MASDDKIISEEPLGGEPMMMELWVEGRFYGWILRALVESTDRETLTNAIYAEIYETGRERAAAAQEALDAKRLEVGL